jgi:hypothetical protein
LKIGAALSDAGALPEELKDFQRKVSDAGRATYNARTEPIAALYEQQKVHHVGTFPTLEDQMCAFTSGLRPRPQRLFAGPRGRFGVGANGVERPAAHVQHHAVSVLVRAKCLTPCGGITLGLLTPA